MKTILVADDDENIRVLLETELALEGYNVILAASGLEALREIRKKSPDLVILDIKMPGMHGLEVLEEIRKENEKLPVVICTAYGKMKDDYAVWASKVAGYLTKPLDLKVLGTTVGKALAGERARRTGEE